MNKKQKSLLLDIIDIQSTIITTREHGAECRQSDPRALSGANDAKAFVNQVEAGFPKPLFTTGAVGLRDKSIVTMVWLSRAKSDARKMASCSLSFEGYGKWVFELEEPGQSVISVKGDSLDELFRSGMAKEITDFMYRKKQRPQSPKFGL